METIPDAVDNPQLNQVRRSFSPLNLKSISENSQLQAAIHAHGGDVKAAEHLLNRNVQDAARQGSQPATQSDLSQCTAENVASLYPGQKQILIYKALTSPCHFSRNQSLASRPSSSLQPTLGISTSIYFLIFCYAVRMLLHPNIVTFRLTVFWHLLGPRKNNTHETKYVPESNGRIM
jgi:hypothetical protein